MAHNVIFESIKDIDLSVLERPQVAVFLYDEDYPGKIVGKIMDSGQKTNMNIVRDRVIEVYEDIRKYTDLQWCCRGKDDVIELLGVFL